MWYISFRDGGGEMMIESRYVPGLIGHTIVHASIDVRSMVCVVRCVQFRLRHAAGEEPSQTALGKKDSPFGKIRPTELPNPSDVLKSVRQAQRTGKLQKVEQGVAKRVEEGRVAMQVTIELCGIFMSECCEVRDDVMQPTDEFRVCMSDWCRIQCNNDPKLAHVLPNEKNLIKRCLEGMGFVSHKMSAKSGVHCWLGLRLREGEAERIKQIASAIK